MSKLAFLTMVTLVAAILSPSVIVNSFAKSSDGDSGNSGGSDNNDKPKISGHKKVDNGGVPVPGLPAPKRVDNKNKDSNNGGGLIVPGSPAVTADGGGSNDGNTGYNNDNNIKTFDTSKSSFRIGGSDGQVVKYKPGFNETFYNSTLPYCYAVTTGTCYDSSTGHIIP